MTRARLVLAALFAWGGVGAVVYAPLAPLLPPLVERPVPPLTFALGAAHLFVALGLVRGWTIAMPVGIALVCLDAAAQALLLVAVATSAGPGGLYLVAILFGELLVDAAMVVALALGRRPIPEARSPSAG